MKYLSILSSILILIIFSPKFSFAQSADTCQGFELFPLDVLNNTIMEGWSNTANNQPNWEVNIGETGSSNTGPLFAALGSQYIYLETSSSNLGDTDTLNSPSFDISGMTSPQLSFLYHMFGSDINELRYELSDDGGVTWIFLDSLLGQQQISSVDDWKREVADLSSFNSPIQIRFVGIAGNSFRGDIALDEVCIEEPQTCPEVFSLSSARNGDSTILVNWAPGGNEIQWLVSVGPEGSAPSAGNQTLTNIDSLEISGLAPNNLFTAHIRGICAPGDSSAWQSVTFGFFFNDTCTNAIQLSCNTTAAGDLNTVRTRLSPFCEADDPLLSRNANVSFEDFERMQWYSIQGTGEEITLDLDLENPNTSSYIQIFTGTCDSLCCRDDLNLFEQQVSFLSHPDTTYLISIVNDFNFIGSRFDLTISCDSCYAPRDVIVSNITENSVEVSWSPNPFSDGFELEFGLAGFSQGSGTIISGNTSGGPVLIQNLADGVTFDFYMAENCGGNLGNLFGPLSFETLCSNATRIAPYCEGFDGDIEGELNGGERSCWTNTSTNRPGWSIDANTTASPNTGPDAPQVGSRYIYLECTGGSLGDTDTITGPVIDISNLTNPEFTFFYHMFGAAMGTLKWDISDDLGATWLTLDSLTGQQQTSSNDPWILVQEDLSAFTGTIQLRFIGIRGNGFRGDMALDEICVKNNCIPSISLSGTQDNQVFNANQTINSTATVTGGKVDYFAGDRINLDSEFEVELGAVFNAIIEACQD